MSTITHAIIGAALGMILYSWTLHHQKQFKIEHLIVFAINNFIGPDFPKLLSPFFGREYFQNLIFLQINDFVHSYVGWVIISGLLSGLYYGIFQLSKEARTTKKITITFLHIYLLIVAAGFLHFGIDLLDGSVRIVPISFGVNWIITLETFKTGNSWAEGPLWDQMNWFDDKYLLLLGIICLIILIWVLKHKSLKMSWGLGLIFTGIIYALIILIGSNAVENENDVGILLYICMAWLIPIILCLLSLDNKVETITSKSESTMM